MKNYLCLDGKKIELTEKQLKEIKDSFVKKRRLGDVPVGDVVGIGSYDFIVLDHNDGETRLLMKGVYKEDVKFGPDNNYKNSDVKKICDEFAKGLEYLVGSENIISHKVDLTSLDGLRTYDACYAKCSLMTFDMARSYVDILDRYKLDQYWWLCTPWSTPEHGYSSTVCIVSPSGYIFSNIYVYNNFGVRPFCIFNSDIFVS